MLGGFGQDAIDVDRETGELIGDDTGDDVVIGDNGAATFFTDGGSEVLVRIETTDPSIGDRDLINTNSGNDVVIGGAGGDLIDAGTTNERDIVIGDNGFAQWTTDDRISTISTTDPAVGGDDDIVVGDGSDIVLGGVGSDAIDADRLTGLSVGVETCLLYTSPSPRDS